MPIARTIQAPKLDSDEPSSEKIVWKLLPRLTNTDHVLFLSFAALETVYGLKSVYVALTTSLVVLISLEKDEVIEIISIDRAYPLIDDNDSTLINLNVTKENLDETTELKGVSEIELISYVVHNMFFYSFSMVEFCNIFKIRPKTLWLIRNCQRFTLVYRKLTTRFHSLWMNI